jgi:bifunctional DNA-binding transcriptional regulator/antitoxin component of YhaV-PrlF toxin-antitoxin module
MAVNGKPLSLARLNERGQLTLPAEYRWAHQLEHDSTLVLVEIGDARVLVPHDEALAVVTARLESALKGADSSTDEIIRAAEKSRAKSLERRMNTHSECVAGFGFCQSQRSFQGAETNTQP